MHAALLTMRALGRGYFVHALLVFFLLQFMKCDTLYESAPRRFLPVLKSWVKNCSLGKWRQIFCWWFGPLGSATLAVRNISRQAIYSIGWVSFSEFEITVCGSCKMSTKETKLTIFYLFLNFVFHLPPYIVNTILLFFRDFFAFLHSF